MPYINNVYNSLPSTVTIKTRNTNVISMGHMGCIPVSGIIAVTACRLQGLNNDKGTCRDDKCAQYTSESV